MESMESAAHAWLEFRAGQGRARSTLANNRTAVLRMVDSVGPATPPGRVTEEDVEAWRRQMVAAGYDAGTIRGRLSAASQFFQWCCRRSLATANPVEDIERPPLPRRRPRVMPDVEVTRVEAAARDPRERVVVSLELREGLRAMEVCGLRWEHMDMGGGWVFVACGKGGHQRRVPMTTATREAVEAYVAAHPPAAFTGPVVRRYGDNRSPLRPDYVSRMVSRLMTRAGVKRAPKDGRSGHALRHTAIDRVYGRSRDIRLAQEFAGHASMATTQVYMGSADGAAMRAAMED